MNGNIQSAGTFATKKEASQAAQDHSVASRHDIFKQDTTGEKRFSEWAPMALDLMDIGPRTRSNYEGILRRTLIPAFGKKRLRDISPTDVLVWWTKQPNIPARKNNYMLLSGVMRRAVKLGELKTNPCQIENAGKGVVKPRPTLDDDSFWNLVDAADDDMRLFILTVWGASLRIGEALGLERRDIDLKNGTINIVRQRAWTKGGISNLNEPKNGHQRLGLSLYPEALSALRSALDTRPMLPTAPVFTNTRGGHLDKRAVYQKWDVLRSQLGLEWLHVHDLRHVSLTHYGKYAGIEESMVRAGHTTPAMALHYRHVSEGRDAAIAASIGRPEKRAHA